jgi:6-phosphogluconolactonase
MELGSTSAGTGNIRHPDHALPHRAKRPPTRPQDTAGIGIGDAGLTKPDDQRSDDWQGELCYTHPYKTYLKRDDWNDYLPTHLFSNPETLAAGAADFICVLANACIAENGRFLLVLSGGSTPAHTYQRLVVSSHRHKLDWSKVQIFWGDERCVPPDHPQSNYRMAREALLDSVALPSENIHRIAGEAEPESGAWEYERLLHALFPDQPWPQFDLVLLGLGEDGHTASLFPGTDILEQLERWVAPVFVPHFKSWRISLTLPAINAAANVAFLVTGAAKASILSRILQSNGEDRDLPASRIHPQEQLHWVLEDAASSQVAPG